MFYNHVNLFVGLKRWVFIEDLYQLLVHYLSKILSTINLSVNPTIISTSKTFIFLFRDLRDKTMADDLMYIPNDATQNYPFCRLQLVDETFGHST